MAAVTVASMSNRTTARLTYRCHECGWTAAKWVGRCGECQSWGTVVEVGASGHPLAVAPRTAPRPMSSRPATSIGQVDATPATTRPTGVSEFDRVFGGGLVRGSVALIAGEPGVGKSTLLLDIAARVARAGATVLYATAEESVAQVRSRADRIEALAPSLYLVAETDLAAVLGHLESTRFDLVILDSVQTVTSAAVDGGPGSVSQVREVAACLIHAARVHGSTTLLVGHVTKDGSIAGPRALEHLVDVVAHFEGERHGRVRVLRAVKNRYGPTDEVGCFEVTRRGVTELADPSGLFTSGASTGVPGTCLTVTLDGRRPMICEVQALVTRTGGAPRRTTSGVDAARVAMLMAVLQRHVAVRLLDQDCYVSTVGGARALEPAADLAITMAMAGSAADLVLPPQTLIVGEVGLAGEIRAVPGVQRRLSEGVRLGMTSAVVPAGCLDGPAPEGLRVQEVADVTDAVILMVAPRTRRLRPA